MLEFVHGPLEHVGDDGVVVRCGALALRLRVPRGSIDGLRTGDETRWYSQLILRDELFTLFGFRTASERDLFNVLRSVSGLGPEKALLLLSALRPSQLAVAIRSEDKTRLRAVKGIGERLADRLIVELRDGLDEFLSAEPASPTDASGHLRDVSRALQQLGYPRADADAAATKAFQSAAKGAAFEDILKAALRSMQRGAAS